tara:strand:- start:11732 stop:12133 length:402 start_codon:yes stop_codon:yes gene_type:complete
MIYKLFVILPLCYAFQNVNVKKKNFVLYNENTNIDLFASENKNLKKYIENKIKEQDENLLALNITSSSEQVRNVTNLGKYKDQDGKSNVWAVEPLMEIDKKDINYPLLVSASFGSIAFFYVFIQSLAKLTYDY